jgi:hypothetical protein
MLNIFFTNLDSYLLILFGVAAITFRNTFSERSIEQRNKIHKFLKLRIPNSPQEQEMTKLGFLGIGSFFLVLGVLKLFT